MMFLTSTLDPNKMRIYSCTSVGTSIRSSKMTVKIIFIVSADVFHLFKDKVIYLD